MFSKIRFIQFLGFCIWIAFAFTSCNPAANIPKDSYLLRKNTIKIDDAKFKSDLKPILKQKPNRKILGIWPFSVQTYALFDHGRENGFKKWMKKTIGEEPVVYDPVLTRKSSLQLKLFLQKNGYFDAQVTDTATFRNKRAKVTYLIKVGVPSYIDKISYSIEDRDISKLVMKDTSLCQIKSGSIFNADNIGLERTRLTKLIREDGFFFFNQEYIRFLVDSGKGKDHYSLSIIVDNPEFESSDSTPSDLRHKRYYLNDITVNSTFRIIENDSASVIDTTLYDNYLFVRNHKIKTVRPKTLTEQLFFRKGDQYSLKDQTLSFRRLQDLNSFRYINIDYSDAGYDTLNKRNLINSIINLGPGNLQEHSEEFEVTNNGGAAGVAGNIAYRNKNIFNGAEIFEFKVRGSLEKLQSIVESSAVDNSNRLFNSWTLGPELSLKLPKFLIPFSHNSRTKLLDPGTIFSLFYYYEHQPDFDRTQWRASMGYTWKAEKYFRHFVYPVELTYYRIPHKTDEFKHELETSQDLGLQTSFSDHTITDTRYVNIFTNQDLIRKKSFWYIRSTIELSGNVLSAYHKIFTKDEMPYTFLNVPFSEYVRGETDVRYYQVLSPRNTLVYRFNLGLGKSYGNGGDNLPFEKAFFAGGANDLRSFRARTVGPGSYVSNDNFEKFGDIKINLNLEYRFDLIKVLQGALFIDAGNVWNFKEGQYPGSEFHFDSFISEFAVGPGLGLRLNFSFFILRLDGAVEMRNPANPPSERWVIQDFNQFNDIKWNFGIGYPF